MSLIKGPFLIKIDDMTIDHVTKIIYTEGKLGVDVLITDYEQATYLLSKSYASQVQCIGCGKENIGATYYVKKYKSGVVLEDNAVMVLRLIFDVTSVIIGEVKEKPKFAMGGFVCLTKEPVFV